MAPPIFFGSNAKFGWKKNVDPLFNRPATLSLDLEINSIQQKNKQTIIR
jgi:hypothetical protein